MDTSHLTLWKLEIFCRVLEERSFSQAARSLNVSQPTVSGHVADLERLFGTRLFDRSSGRIVPTRAGELLYEQGRKLALLKDETVRVMENLLDLVGGEARVGGSTIPGTYLLPEVLARFKAEHPTVACALRIADSQRILEMVLEGRIEIGVVGSDPAHALLRDERFVEDQLVLLLPTDHPLARHDEVPVEALLGHPFLLRESGSGTRQLVERRLAAADGPTLDQLDVVCELGSSAAIKEAVRQGLGISLISRHVVAGELPLGQLTTRPITGVDLTRWFRILTHRRRTLSPAARVFMDLLRQRATVPPDAPL